MDPIELEHISNVEVGVARAVGRTEAEPAPLFSTDDSSNGLLMSARDGE